jgi:hypothetical protein
MQPSDWLMSSISELFSKRPSVIRDLAAIHLHRGAAQLHCTSPESSLSSYRGYLDPALRNPPFG